MVNNYLEIVILNVITLPVPGIGPIPYVFPSLAGGNIELVEETLESIEVGWVGTFNGHTVTLAVYETETFDAIDFFTAAFYSGSFPPPNWPLPDFILDIPPSQGGLAGLLPAAFSYRNSGDITNTGVEFSWAYRSASPWGFYLNGSWQDEPETTGIEPELLPNGESIIPVNTPPEWRFNTAVTYNTDGWFGSFGLNYQDEAFWTDVLDSRFWGPTDSFTQFNAALGYRFSDNVSLAVNGQNIFDAEVQQHVFGDIISRKVTGVLHVNF